MGKIVVPLDGSALAEQALGPAEQLVRLFNGRIELIYVVDGVTRGDPEAVERADQAEQYLESVAERFSADLPVQLRIIEGSDPAAEIVRIAGTASDTHIVMSTRGHGTIGRLVFGSVAEAVIRRSRVPVTLIHGKFQSRPGPIRRIIVPLDGSQLAEQALQPASNLAQRADATISLVQVLDLPAGAAYGDFAFAPGMIFDSVEQARDEARSNLDSVAGLLRGNCVRTTWEVRVGGTAQEIARAATTTGADLIVMSTHGRTGLRRIALGSVTHEVVRSGAAPVLVVPTVITTERLERQE
jgi:nucleotide-binding universal stress UspA family protein